MKKQSKHKREKQIYLNQLLLAIIGVILWAIILPQSIIPFLMGCLFMTLNFWVLSSFWSRVFNKKPIAMTIVLVITKYAGLIILLYLLVNKWRVHLFPVIAGITTIVGAFLLLALQIALKEK